ncbi:MAG: dCTP deaminase domain-containing protein [Janthinobacterium lividum]
MSFLSNKRLLQILPTCINPYDPGRIESGAYELSMGNEYFTTNAETATKTLLSEREQFVIEPGQFALLITKETISIPASNLGFISVKAGVKFRGLINVSGFHVDPGFHGRLKLKPTFRRVWKNIARLSWAGIPTASWQRLTEPMSFSGRMVRPAYLPRRLAPIPASQWAGCTSTSWIET